MLQGTLRGRAWVCLGLCAVLTLAPALLHGSAQRSRDAWTPDLLAQWIGAAERHAPGDVDSVLIGAGRWSADDLRKLWVDVQMVLHVVEHPERSKFDVTSLGTAAQPVNLLPEERTALDVLVTRVRGLGMNALLKRAAIVHTDVATLAGGLASSAGPTSSGGPVRMRVGDGNSLGLEGTSLHWTLARMLLTRVTPDPGVDVFVRDWYRATVAVSQGTASFDQFHMRRGLLVFPKDPVLLMLAGCEREAFAGPLFQAFAKSLSIRSLRSDIEDVDDELAKAARFYRAALAADPALAEARLRLGRVLYLQGRHADSARELRTALSQLAEPVLAYYAQLFLGAALEALGDVPAARDSFTQAAALVPGARAPHLALARLARELGDRDETATQLALAMSAPLDERDIDPWWRYLASQGRRGAAWLNDVRRAAQGPVA